VRLFAGKLGEVFRRPVGGHAAPGGALEKAALNQVGFFYKYFNLNSLYYMKSS
jgi:hypothetical protein